MKRIIAVLLLTLVLCFSFSACGEVDLDTLFVGNTDITFTVENGEATVTKVPNKTIVTEIVIPDEYEGVPVTKIADFSATNLEYVTEITIGKNVREISDWAFGNSKKVTKIEVDDNNQYLCDVEGVVYTKDMKVLLFYPPQKGVVTDKDENGNEVKYASYEIPEGVESIRSKAFYKCSDLKEIKLPSTIKTIEEKAFFLCDPKEIILPDGLETIGKDAFGFCSSLKEVTVPASVTRIDDYAFYSCTSLLEVNMLGNESDITLGKKWYPTNNGASLGDELIINWKNQ